MRAATRSAALRTNSAKPDQIRDQLARESCRIPEHPRENKAGPTEAGQSRQIPQITPSKNRPHLPDTDRMMNEIEHPRSTGTTQIEHDHGNIKIRSRIGRPNNRSDQRWSRIEREEDRRGKVRDPANGGYRDRGACCPVRALGSVISSSLPLPSSRRVPPWFGIGGRRRREMEEREGGRDGRTRGSLYREVLGGSPAGGAGFLRGRRIELAGSVGQLVRGSICVRCH